MVYRRTEKKAAMLTVVRTTKYQQTEVEKFNSSEQSEPINV